MYTKVKNLLMVIIIMVQVMLFGLYSFAETQLSNIVYLILWCMCAGVIYIIGKNSQIG